MVKETLPALTKADRRFTRCHRVGLPETESEMELDVQDVFQRSASEGGGAGLSKQRSWAVL